MAAASSIFTKIINREVPAQFLYEDELCVVILDKYPSVQGQSLVIPKTAVAYAFDLPNEIYHHIFDVAKKVAHASDRAFSTERTCLVIEGFEVPHVHLKLYPMPAGSTELASSLTAGAEATDAELEIIGTQLQAAIEEDEDAS